jgi:hypothetical protein
VSPSVEPPEVPAVAGGEGEGDDEAARSGK